jgi:hypothetical protein
MNLHSDLRCSDNLFAEEAFADSEERKGGEIATLPATKASNERRF